MPAASSAEKDARDAGTDATTAVREDPAEITGKGAENNADA
jgi:hypothetical protein